MTAPPPIITPEQARQFVADAQAAFAAAIGEGMARIVDAFAPIVFSALDTEPAREIEPLFAARGAFVFSNASAFRMAEDVPLLVPEANPDHLRLIETQQRNRGWKGAIITNPNCTATILVMALAPLHQAFGVQKVMMTSMQAVSVCRSRPASVFICGTIACDIARSWPVVMRSENV